MACASSSALGSGAILTALSQAYSWGQEPWPEPYTVYRQAGLSILLQEVILSCTLAWVGSERGLPVSAGTEREGCKVAAHLEQVQVIHFSGSEKHQLSQGLGQAAKAVINRT